jgi:hypothetical protein
LIHKRLEIKSVETQQAGPRLELTGSGETIFDLKAGLPKRIRFAGTFTMREGGQTFQAPVTLECQRVAAGEAAKLPPDLPPPGAAPAPAAIPESAASARARLEGSLAELRAVPRDWARCFRALEELATIKPIEGRRDEVADVLDDYLAEKNYSARVSALRAARTWATRQNEPALVRLLDPSESESIRRKALEILGKLGDPRAAAAIAGRLKDRSDRAAAASALCALGPAAEDAALAVLADPDAGVYDEACQVLGEIGGAKSIAALRQQADGRKGPARTSAKAALRKLLRKR